MKRIGAFAMAAAAAGLTATAALASGPVLAPADPVVPAPVAAPVAAPTGYDWSGAHIGLTLGRPFGDNNWAERSLGVQSTPGSWGGTPWGIGAGYDVQRGTVVYGAAIDYSPGSVSATSTTGGGFGCIGNVCQTSVDNALSIRGRIGVAYDRTLLYATAGLASAEVQAQGPIGPANVSNRLNGWTAGLGVEHALTDTFSINVEYLFTDLGRLEIPAPCGVNCYSDVSYGTIRLGANFRF